VKSGWLHPPFIFLKTILSDEQETVMFPETYINISFCKHLIISAWGTSMGVLIADLNETEWTSQL
jgi:hypothetical protein